MEKVLTPQTINKDVLSMQYAVKGLVPTTAAKIAAQLPSPKYGFEEILSLNIGNPQSVGQKPITYFRDVLALVNAPHLLQNKASLSTVFKPDVISRAEEILSTLPNGTGAYSNSQGVLEFRKTVAKFIEHRDGHPADPSKIFITNGATTAINIVLQILIQKPSDGILIPIPQYPIYSALIELLGATQLTYYLQEQKAWGVSLDDVKRSVEEAKAKGVKPKAMVIINPGNPTGSVLEYDQIKSLVKYCYEERMVLLADEVYQVNIYSEKKKFYSVKKVVRDMCVEDPKYESFEFVSFHSTSKGILGECGRRGGYMEVCGFDEDVFSQMVKLASSAICSSLDGQLMTSLMVTPPEPGDESYPLYHSETEGIFQSLKRKSEVLYGTLNTIPGIECQKLQGSMFAFPKIDFSKSAIKAAEAVGHKVDTFYCLSLLNKTGICCVPGSGFGQEEGTYHIRMTFLPPEEKLIKAMKAFEEHHLEFMLGLEILCYFNCVLLTRETKSLFPNDAR
eukprot:maker-scaffold_3-snap-gene-3.0-mRNA-1 protein AED:0.05 eAED:0.07 QI:0/0/0.33/1/0/0/3/1486/505